METQNVVSVEGLAADDVVHVSVAPDAGVVINLDKGTMTVSTTTLLPPAMSADVGGSSEVVVSEMPTRRAPGRPRGSLDKIPRKRRTDLKVKEVVVRVIEGATDDNPAPFGFRKDGTPAAKRGRKLGSKMMKEVSDTIPPPVVNLQDVQAEVEATLDTILATG